MQCWATISSRRLRSRSINGACDMPCHERLLNTPAQKAAYLFEESVDPAIVAAHEAQGVEVAYHASNHARDPGNGFKEDNARQPLALVHLAGPISGDEVKGGTDGLDGVICCVIKQLQTVCIHSRTTLSPDHLFYFKESLLPLHSVYVQPSVLSGPPS
jgi:hypothetical protein